VTSQQQYLYQRLLGRRTIKRHNHPVKETPHMKKFTDEFDALQRWN